MISLIPIEPLNDEHALLIIEAFNKHFIDGGGEQDGNGNGDGYGYSFGRGYGDGYGDGRGCGYGYGDGRGFGVGNVPEEWLIDEISMKPTGGQNQEMLRDQR